MHEKTSILILAAGRSLRMRGEDKLIKNGSEVPLLASTFKAASDSRADEVFVVLPFGDRLRCATLPIHANCLYAPKTPQGMGVSIATGISALRGADNILITLADMPFLTSEHFDQLLIAAHDTPTKSIFRLSSNDGTPGHPVLFRGMHFEALSTLSGDQGAQGVLAANPDQIRLVAAKDKAPIIDIDTPEDWARYR